MDSKLNNSYYVYLEIEVQMQTIFFNAFYAINAYELRK